MRLTISRVLIRSSSHTAPVMRVARKAAINDLRVCMVTGREGLPASGRPRGWDWLNFAEKRNQGVSHRVAVRTEGAECNASGVDRVHILLCSGNGLVERGTVTI